MSADTRSTKSKADHRGVDTRRRPASTSSNLTMQSRYVHPEQIAEEKRLRQVLAQLRTPQPADAMAGVTRRRRPTEANDRDTLARRRPAVRAQPVRPGEMWAGRRGDEIWTLSGRWESMTRHSDGADLTSLRSNADALIRGFLSVRPTGGRVWVNEDGDAVTNVGGNAIYLGNIGTEEPGEPGLGDPMPGFVGRKYTVMPTDVTDRATGVQLSTHRSANVVRSVVDGLLRIRPGGGAYRVNDRGDAATYVDGQWVYAGQVSLEYWFPPIASRAS